MKINELLKTEKIPQLWVIFAVLIYGLLLAEFTNAYYNKVFFSQPDFSPTSLFSYTMKISYILIIVMSFVVWIITSFIYHLFATLFGGSADFYIFQKYTGLVYFFSAIFILAALLIVDNVEITQDSVYKLLQENKAMRWISWLIYIPEYLYYIIIIPIIRYLYNINWLKSMGVVAIPIGSIYLLSQFFANYVL